MYPATTSLVNVVPKLNATGRDLLQVSAGPTLRALSGGLWSGGCVSLSAPPAPPEPAEVQPGAADLCRGGPAAPLLHGLLPTIGTPQHWAPPGAAPGTLLAAWGDTAPPWHHGRWGEVRYQHPKSAASPCPPIY